MGVSSLVAKWSKSLFKKICNYYVDRYPVDRELKKQIRKYHCKPEKRIEELEKLKRKTIEGALWANSGTIFSLLLTIISTLATLLWSVINFVPLFLVKSDLYDDFLSLTSVSHGSFKIVVYIAIVPVFILVTRKLILLLSPILINRIIENLPAEKYAELTLNKLNQSEILTFTAFKIWSLCKDFIEVVEAPPSYRKIMEKGIFDSSLFNRLKNKNPDQELSLLLEESQSLYENITYFKARYHQSILKCSELKDQAVKKLGILPREFSHHILKFSTSVFQVRINNLKIDSDTICYMLINEAAGYELIIENNLQEILRIIDGVKTKFQRDLRQIILHDSIHEHLIGMSSITSTSESLKIFTRGIGMVVSKLGNNVESESKVCDELKSLLHRSKAHYGVDLLISLENFYRKNSQTQSQRAIPDIIASIKNTKKSELIVKNKLLLRDILKNISEKYEEAIKSMREQFKSNVSKLEVGEGFDCFFVVFGYSRMVRNVITTNSSILEAKRSKVFVLKENNQEMLDTRMLRFELNDHKSNRYRTTFTSSDESFYNLVKPSDTVVFLAGAEAYDTQNHKLYHTNNYQNRLAELTAKLKSDEKKPNPQIWIVAGDYKIYEEFPPKESNFGQEFFCDHYDKLDIYDFSEFYKEGALEVITNITSIPPS